jgi:hypothetical protein
MPAMRVFVPQKAPTVELGGRVHATTGFLRLVGCPRCSGQGRALSEHGGLLVARCLGCGDEFSAPLATVEVSEPRLVGRGGQGIVDLAISDAA